MENDSNTTVKPPENIPVENPTPVVPAAIPVQQEPTPIQSGPIPPVKTRRFPIILKIFLILFIIFIAILVAGGIYIYQLAQKNPVIKNMANVQNLEQVIKDTKNAKSYPGTIIKHNSPPVEQSNINQNSSPSSSQTAVTNTTTDQNLQWSTYENKGYKFSIDFPADLQENETAPGFGVSTIEFKSTSDTSNGLVFQILIMPKSIAKMIGQDFDAFYAMTDNSSQIIKGSNSSSVNLTKINNRTVRGLRAIDFKSTTNPQDPNLEAEAGTYIEAGTNLIIISGGESNKTTLESMLATFKYPI